MTKITTDRATAELKDIYNNVLEFKDEITTITFDEAIEALEKVEKYRWHNLRKNPEDLPIDGATVLVARRFRTHPKSMYYSVISFTDDLSKVNEYDFSGEVGVAGFYEFNPEWGYCTPENIVAWKYIEPFEEVE